MPSACLKTEKKAPMEAEDAMKQCIIVVDKKVRNLEKRKGKLEGYREKSRQGDELNSDQKEAISSYDAVLRNLEFARELQKQFCEIQEKAEKLLKKRAKFEKQDRHNEEVARIQELLKVQSLLDNMGAEDVREDFKTGNKGAVTLSEESLNQLDELYKLISPSRDGEQSYTSQLTQAADHIVNFLDAKDKEVAGTTYKNLKDLIRQINECGYFEKTNVEEDQTTTEQAKETESTTEVTEEPLEETPKVEEDSTVVSDAAMATAPEQASSRISPVQSQPQAAEPRPTPPPQTQIHTESLPNTLQPNPATHNVYEQQDQGQAESLFTGGQMARPRAFQEIVSSVQGSFDFLQDSEIDTQQKAKKAQEGLHADPAVVVASRTLAGSSLHTNAATDPLSQSFGSSAAPKNLLEDQQPTQYQQSTKNQSVSENSLSQSQGFADVLSAAPSQPQSAQFGQSSTFEPDMDSKWSQGIYLPTSTTTESIDRSWGEQASGSAVATPSQSWGDQTASQTPSWSTGQQGASAAAAATVDSQVSDLPAPIPMPPSQQQPAAAPSSHAAAPPPAFSTGNQDNVPSFSQVTSNNQETKSSLNPNADIWYSSQSTNFSQDSGNEFDSSNQMSSKHDHYGSSDMAGGYQSQGYRGRRDYESRGGPRGGRGGPRGNVTNGYGGGRGGSRGGSSYRGDDRRGGPRGGSRGGPSLQGYQPRSNYQSDGGYQGSSNSSNTYSYSHDSGAGFTNKSWGGQRGGGMRGGNRGGSGPRGGSRGNYSRPTSATNQ